MYVNKSVKFLVLIVPLLSLCISTSQAENPGVTCTTTLNCSTYYNQESCCLTSTCCVRPSELPSKKKCKIGCPEKNFCCTDGFCCQVSVKTGLDASAYAFIILPFVFLILIGMVWCCIRQRRHTATVMMDPMQSQSQAGYGYGYPSNHHMHQMGGGVRHSQSLMMMTPFGAVMMDDPMNPSPIDPPPEYTPSTTDLSFNEIYQPTLDEIVEESPSDLNNDENKNTDDTKNKDEDNK